MLCFSEISRLIIKDKEYFAFIIQNICSYGKYKTVIYMFCQLRKTLLSCIGFCAFFSFVLCKECKFIFIFIGFLIKDRDVFPWTWSLTDATKIKRFGQEYLYPSRIYTTTVKPKGCLFWRAEIFILLNSPDMNRGKWCYEVVL